MGRGWGYPWWKQIVRRLRCYEGRTNNLRGSKKIVKEFCTRPVLSKHRDLIKSAIKEHGYNGSHLISCRSATFPEIQVFYQRPPYGYSEEKSASVATTAMQQENAGAISMHSMDIFASSLVKSCLKRAFYPPSFVYSLSCCIIYQSPRRLHTI